MCGEFDILASSHTPTCRLQCIDGESPKCVECTRAKCLPAFSSCSSIPIDEVPNKAIAVAEKQAVVAEASCSSDDLAYWESTGKAAFKKDMNECGLQCFGAGQCVTDCLAARHPTYSAGCAGCHGDLAQCTRDQCL